MRLIDADALRKQICEQCIIPMQNNNPCTYEMNEHCGIMKMIKKMPTIDPVKHGHWVKSPYECICSVCHSEQIRFENTSDMFDWVRRAKYCYLCGAKMDEVIE